MDKITRIFIQKGLDNTSISDIETATDLARSSIYAAFGDKDSLVRRCTERYQTKAFESVQQLFSHYEDSITPLQHLKNWMDQMVMQTSDGCLIQSVSEEKFFNCQNTAQWLTEHREQYQEMMSSYLSHHFGGLVSSNELTSLSNSIITLQGSLMAQLRAGIPRSHLRELTDLFFFGIEEKIKQLTT